MRYLLVFTFLLVIRAATAQQVIDLSQSGSDANFIVRAVGGEPILSAKVVRTVEGSPYFRDEWMNTSVFLVSGAQYYNFPARLNLMDGTLHYLNFQKEELVTRVPLREVAFVNGEGQRIRFVHSRHIDAPGLKEGWYQWLTAGKALLYKYYEKIADLRKPYGSAVEEQTIRTRERYFVVQDGKVYELKKLRDVPSVLPARQQEVKTFLSDKSLQGLSTEEKYLALVRYYNTLL